ncbi:E3 ubiquitin-protein ligase hrd1 [Sorochytrium milnesiophthora]
MSSAAALMPWRGVSRLTLFGLSTTLLAISVVANAWVENGHFYTAAIHVSRSRISMMALMFLGLYCTFMLGKGLQKAIFGQLRNIEVEHLYERSWMTITETLIAMTIFRSDFDSHFVFHFTLLLFLKVFHWISSDRVEYIEQLQTAHWTTHIRLQLFMGTLFILDCMLSAYAATTAFQQDYSVLILFLFEYTLLSTAVLVTMVKYAFNRYDATREHPWEMKTTLFFYIDMIHDFFRLINFVMFFALIWNFYGPPLHIVRDLYNTLRSLLLKIRDVVRYRQATRNMDTRYPNATAEELGRLSDRTCIICREEMYAENEQRPDQNDDMAGQVPPVPASVRRSQTPKKLQCGHIFHFGCLRSWLERQQSCPTCRRSVVEMAAPAAAAVPPMQAGVQREPAAQQPVRAPGGPFQHPLFPPFAQAAAPVAPTPPPPPSNSSGATSGAAYPSQVTSMPSSQPVPNEQAEAQPIRPPFPIPAFSAASTGGVAQSSLSHLTDEQLQMFITGATDRQSLETRVRLLCHVQEQVAASITLLTQILAADAARMALASMAHMEAPISVQQQQPAVAPNGGGGGSSSSSSSSNATSPPPLPPNHHPQ